MRCDYKKICCQQLKSVYDGFMAHEISVRVEAKIAVVHQGILGESQTIESLLSEAKELSEKIEAAFRLRSDAEKKMPGLQGSDRAFYLNWANHDIGTTVSYLRLAIDASMDQYPFGTSDADKRADRERRKL
jgi:hypothetical protein